MPGLLIRGDDINFFLRTEEGDNLAEVNQQFAKEMNAIAEGNIPDIRDATDDTTFERRSRDLVKLYK